MPVGALPRSHGSGATCHLRFQSWVKAVVFQTVHRKRFQHDDAREGIGWQWPRWMATW